MAAATAKRVTVADCDSTRPVSEVGGHRRHTFSTSGQQTFFLRCTADGGRHDFAVGHLAAFEATSSLPSRRMAQGLQRLGLPAEIVGYYTEHVEADAVHEQVALRDVCVRLVAEEPGLEPDVWFGAWACLDLENRTARRLLSGWGVAA